MLTPDSLGVCRASGCFWLCLEAPVMIAERRRLFLLSWLRFPHLMTMTCYDSTSYPGLLQLLAYKYCLLTITGLQ